MHRSARCLAGAFALLVTAALAPAIASASEQYPVPYTFTANVVAAALEPGTPPPGSNDWSCLPPAAHPDPVVLVHGLLANMTDNWQTMSPLLANNGYCVFALTYGDNPQTSSALAQFGGLAPMEQSAEQLSAFVDKVRAATGARKVDIVGHSEGATMPDYYLEYLGGAAKVARYVGVSGAKHGTTLHGVGSFAAEYGTLFPGAADAIDGWCGSCEEFLVGSGYIHAIEARAPARGVVYTNLATRYDELVEPAHQQLPRGAERHEHHDARPLRARFQRPPVDHLEPDHGPVHPERARSRARAGATLRAGPARRLGTGLRDGSETFERLLHAGAIVRGAVAHAGRELRDQLEVSRPPLHPGLGDPAPRGGGLEVVTPLRDLHAESADAEREAAARLGVDDGRHRAPLPLAVPVLALELRSRLRARRAADPVAAHVLG